jgi:uncharacterized membrane protein
MLTSLISVLVVLAIFGLVTYLIVTFIPMPAPVKTVIIAIVVLVMVLWLLQTFLGDVHVRPLKLH